MFIFVSGNSGSGKSKWSEKKLISLAQKNNLKKFYIATAKANDHEMILKIKKHKESRRNKNFITIEQNYDILNILNLIPENSAIIIEDLPNLLANEFFNSKKISMKYISKKIFDEIINIKNSSKHLILVSDDIFSDGIIYNKIIDDYIKLLAELHIKFASASDLALEFFSGFPFEYHKFY